MLYDIGFWEYDDGHCGRVLEHSTMYTKEEIDALVLSCVPIAVAKKHASLVASIPESKRRDMGQKDKDRAKGLMYDDSHYEYDYSTFSSYDFQCSDLMRLIVDELVQKHGFSEPLVMQCSLHGSLGLDCLDCDEGDHPFSQAVVKAVADLKIPIDGLLGLR